MFDLMGQMSGHESQDEVCREIFNLFDTICSPGVMALLPMHDGKPGEVLLRPPSASREAHRQQMLGIADHGWTQSGTGFIMRINLKQECLGFLLVDEILLLQNIPQYLNMALTVKPVLAIALANARNLEQRRRREQELTEKSSELERFSYTVSHDLKSPLITFMTYLGYLKEDIEAQDKESIAQDMGFMRSAGDKMVRMLDDILKLSRIGRAVDVPVRLTFRALADEALFAVSGRIAEKNVEVRVGDVESTLLGDGQRLGEIWQNLIENSIKYMGDQKEPCIEIGAEVHDGAPVYFVRDNGMGIDLRYKDKVFGLFDKLDQKSEGSGLGLALVKRIVELYQGTIWMESAGAGKGTCFKFTLPGAAGNEESGITNEE